MPNDQATPSGYGPQWADHFEPEELVVSLSHERFVRARILELAPEITFDDSAPADQRSNRTLNLSRLKLVHLSEAGGTLRELIDAHGLEATQLPGVGSVPGDTATDLDRLLFCLRFHTAKYHGGWIPELAKNRQADSVTGLPHISGAADPVQYPTPIPAPPAASHTGPPGRVVPVGILDTRFATHDDLDGAYFADPESLFRAAPGTPPPHRAGHALFSAGLIRQLAPTAALHARWVLDDADAKATVWDVARRMVEFRDAGVAVLSLALGGFTRDDQQSLVISRAVEAVGSDVVLVAAAGNHGAATGVDAHGHEHRKRPVWPAALPGVVAVGALDRSGATCDFSPKEPWVTMEALGADVPSTYLGGDVEIRKADGSTEIRTFDAPYAQWSGTSFASSIVVGRLAALAARNGGDARAALEELTVEAEQAAEDKDLQPGLGTVRLYT